MSWSTRLRNIHTKPIAITRFSMLLMFHNCPFPIWNILSHLRLALSVNTTKRLYEEATSISFADRMDWDDHGSIAMLGADNVMYYTATAQVRLNGNEFQRYTSHFFCLYYNTYNRYNILHTINIWQRHNSPTSFQKFDKNARLFPHKRPENVATLYPSVALTPADLPKLCQTAYNHVRAVANQNVSLLNYPPHVNDREKTRIEFHEPLLNLQTSNYKDMTFFVNHLAINWMRKFT